MNNNDLNLQQTDDSIDLLAVIGTLFDYKWLIAGITAVFTMAGVFYALLATPVYQASALVQIEKKASGFASIEGMSDMFGQESQASTEIKIMTSRMIIGKAVDQLQLDVVAEAEHFPLIGKAIARRYKPENDGTPAPAWLGMNSYNWGGAHIHILQLDLPKHLQNQNLTLIAEENHRFILQQDDTQLLNGETGKTATGNGITLHIDELVANPGTRFNIIKRKRLNTILSYQSQLQASEDGKQTGMIAMSLQHSDAAFAQNLLNEIAKLYVQQNVERMSAEAANSLAFLHQQLPQVRKEMEAAEQLLNSYQKTAKSADISIETQSVLSQMVEIETSLASLQQKQLEMDKKFTREHPLYQTLLSQISSQESRKQELEGKIKNLPETQQELLRLARDVQVSSQIYTQLLQKAQELDIARASTVGNARIIDEAEVNTDQPVAPKKSLIVIIATLLGGMISVVIAFIHNLLHRGVENPAEIEALNLPVYASVPFSSIQDEAQKNLQRGKTNLPLLAVEYPQDPSIEALRSLHTSLHFAMLEADNNIVMISGPSPKVGKSFVSVNLATLMAQTGKKVLLIDADMRKGYLHRFFNMASTGNGFSSLLAKQSDKANTIVHTAITGLDFIPRGAIPPNPSELLLNKYFSELMHELAGHYHMIIIDTPPILAVSDAITVSKIAGASFIVARFGETATGELRATIKQFENNGIKLKGSILNATRKKLLNYYNYQKYGYGYYQYNYTSDKD